MSDNNNREKTEEEIENDFNEDISKMDKQNPTGTGSFSLNRRDGTTIGNYSFALLFQLIFK